MPCCALGGPRRSSARSSVRSAALGGEVVPGHVGGDEVLHLDLSLGVRDAVLPWAPPDEPARARIQRVLPGLLEDARRLLTCCGPARTATTRRCATSSPARCTRRHRTARANAAAADDVLVGFALAGTDAVERGPRRQPRIEVLLRQLARFVRSELDVDERLGRLTRAGARRGAARPPPRIGPRS